jgi:hypothetical protein
MAALDYRLQDDLSKAIRGILLGGRVYLKADMAIGADTVPVGREVDGTNELDGWRFFRNNTNACTIVEPDTTDAPGDIKHSEAVTIHTDTYLAGQTKDILLTSDVTKAYTVAAGAYIRPTTIPTICGQLKFIQSDFIPAQLLDPVPDEWFPGVIVSFKGRVDSSFTNEEIGFLYKYRIYFCDIIRTDRDNTAYLTEQGEILAGLLVEDCRLGGWVLDSEVQDILPWHESIQNARNLKFFTESNYEIGWSQIDMWAMLPRIFDKRPDLS